MEKAVIYLRVSDAKQDYNRQYDDLDKYAQYKGYEVLDVFQEKISGLTKAQSREGFQKLLDFVEKNSVDHLLIWELSRLGRNALDMLNNVELFNSRKINVYAHKESLNTLNSQKERNPTTTLLLSMLSAYAEHERYTILEHSRSGIRRNVAQGGSGTGIIKPYGFKKVKKRLEIDVEEAEVVKEIYEMSNNGMGTTRIANNLNDRNIPTRYNKLFEGKEILTKRKIKKRGEQFKWRDATVYGILTNSIYKGKRLHKDEIFDVEAIIDEHLWNSVQEKLKSNFNKQDINRKYQNVLKGKIVCDKCGRTYFPHKRSNGKDNAYKCLSKRYGNENCGNISINIDKLNNAILPFIRTSIVEHLIKNKDSKISEINREKESLIESAGVLEDDLNVLDDKLQNLLELRLESFITLDQYQRRRSELLGEVEDTKEKLKDILSKIEAEESTIASLVQLGQYGTQDMEVFKNYVVDFIESIVIKEVPITSSLRRLFKNKQDKLVMIQLRPVHHTFTYRFVLSQRTDKMLILDPIVDGDVIGMRLLEDNGIEDFVETSIKYHFKIG